MNNESPLTIILRHKWLVLLTFVIVLGTTALVSKTLEKVYSTDATVLVALPSDDQTFDTVQAGQAIARSYVDIIESPNIAERVAVRLGGGTTSDAVEESTSFEAVPETQLIKITAESTDPAQAKLIADTYARVFIDYARLDLADTTEASISLADPAPLSASPARPRPTLYVLVAAVLGLALGIALAFLAHRLDRRLRTADDVERRFDLPVLARIPRRRRSDASVTAFREGYRVLRTNLQFARSAEGVNSIAVTSGDAGEGKTTSVAHLAIALAESGRRVIAVEADFRRPALQQELMPGLTEPLLPGLSNYLVETASLEQVVHQTDSPNVSLVPAGPLPPSPSALLDSTRGRKAVQDLMRLGDSVVIDCPPLSVGADASVISGWADGVLVVVDLAHSTDRSVREAIRQLNTVQASILGLLLNRDPSMEASSYSYYYGGQGPTDAGGKGRFPWRGGGLRRGPSGSNGAAGTAAPRDRVP